MITIIIKNRFAVFVIFCNLFWGAALAQSDVQPLRNELKRLEQTIQTAHEILAAFPNDQAAVLLQNAEKIFKDLEYKLSLRPRLNPQDIQALISTARNAISIAERAIETAIRSPLQRLRNQLEELMRRAEHEVLGRGHHEAERLVQEAKKMQHQGDAAVNARSLVAIERYRQAIALLEKSLRLAGPPGPAVDDPASFYEIAKEQFAELQRQAREAMATCQDLAAQRIFQQGKKQALAAEDAYRRSDFRLAKQLFVGATRLVMRAMDLCRTHDHREINVEEELGRLTQTIARLEEQLSTQEFPHLTRVLLRAKELARQAEAAASQNQPERAKLLAEQGRRLIARLQRNLSPGNQDFREQCQTALLQLQNDLAEVETQTHEAGNAEAMRFAELARNAYNRAERICVNDHGALRARAGFWMMARLAHQLLLKAEALLQGEDAAPAQDVATVQRRLQQLDAALEEVRATFHDQQPGFAQTIFQQAVELRDRSWAAFQSEQQVLAMELSAIALELLREVSRFTN